MAGCVSVLGVGRRYMAGGWVMGQDWQDRSAGKITEPQRRLLNAIAGDISGQLLWHGCKLSKDDVRHLLSSIAAGWRAVPGWDYGDGRPPGLIMLGASSLSLTRAQATDAIQLGIQLGDDPSSQGINACPVRWSDSVLLGQGLNPNDYKE